MNILDLHILTKKLEHAEAEYDEENDVWIKTIYFGTVMSLTPSGKYYTPFACSNVEICESCKEAKTVPCTEDNPCTYGEAEDWHCEACRDAKWFEQVENELTSIDSYLHTGEGCATDLYISTIVEPET